MTPTAEGKYFYTDAMPGARAQAIVVVEVNGVLCASFTDDEGDRELVPVDDMAGTWATAR